MKEEKSKEEGRKETNNEMNERKKRKGKACIEEREGGWRGTKKGRSDRNKKKRK